MLNLTASCAMPHPSKKKRATLPEIDPAFEQISLYNFE